MNHVSLKLNQNNRPLVQDFSYVLLPGDKTAIIGEEGNGKSTLLKFIYDSSLIEGYCTFKGEVKNNHDKIGYLQQFLDPRWNHESVLNYFFKNSPEEEIDYEKYNLFGDLLKLIAKMGLCEDILDENYLVSYLSGGEKVKIQLCKLLLEKNDILLLDEPTRNLSSLSNPIIRDILTNYQGAIISVSHDRKYINEVCQKAYWFDECGLLSISIEDAVKGKKPKTRSK